MILRSIVSIALILASIEIASADEPQLPVMKDGLWQSHTQMVLQGKKYDTTMKRCRSNELDKSMKSSAETLRKRDKCNEVVAQKSPGSFSSEMHCDAGSMAGSVTKTTMIYKGDTSYHMEQHTTGKSETVTIVDENYLGSCPADMKPGDVVMEDGKRMNGQ